MKVIIEKDCWTCEDTEWRADLVGLLDALRVHKQHSVQARVVSLKEWCAKEAPSLLGSLLSRVNQSQPRADAVELRVHPDGVTSVASDPPWRLHATTAASLVRQPLQLYLENDEHDANFLRAVLPELTQWESAKLIKMEHGGGSHMTTTIKRVAQDRAARWRTFFLFDSDRLHPDELDRGWREPGGDGCQGWRTQRACDKNNVPRSRRHQLNRRSIENYLPPSLLSQRDEFRAEALYSSTVGSMAWFFNLKMGFQHDLFAKGDPERPNPIRAARSRGFWTSLPEEIQAALRQGFGEDVAKLFLQVPTDQAWPPDVRDEVAKLHIALLDAL